MAEKTISKKSEEKQIHIKDLTICDATAQMLEKGTPGRR